MDLFEILLARKLGGGGGGGITPSGTKNITANGNNIDVYSFAKVNVNVPNPSTGKLNITTTSEVDVTNYARAQVVDADLVASNIKKDVNILGVVGTYEGGGGSDTQLKDLIDRSITTINWPNGITKVGYYAFYRCKDLVISSFPNTITEIGLSAFSGVVNGGASDTGIASITATSLPSSLTIIGGNAFAFSNIAVATLPSGLTEIGLSAFSTCKNLQLTTLPSSLTTIGAGAFQRCTGLTTLTCNGNITSIGNNAFVGGGTDRMNLTDVRFPNMTADVMQIFGASTQSNACTKLEIFDAGLTSKIVANAFYNCTKLHILILRNTSVVELMNTSAFSVTPFSGGGSGFTSGTVYVPSALIDTYKTANNWSTLFNGGHMSFSAIEGSPYALT